MKGEGGEIKIKVECKRNSDLSFACKKACVTIRQNAFCFYHLL